MQVREGLQASQLLWETLQFVFRYIEAQQTFQAPYLLKEGQNNADY